jgi:hypothetical protein
MLWNILLLFIVFGAAKKKISPYAAAVVLGLAEAGIYFFHTRNVAGACIEFAVYTVLAAGLVYFLARLDRKPSTGAAYPTPGTAEKVSFQWEYIPLTLLVVFLIFGETVIRFWLK